MSSPSVNSPSNAVKNKPVNPNNDVSAADNLKEKPQNVNPETTDAAKKEAGKSETEKAKKDSKKAGSGRRRLFKLLGQDKN